jgi:sugar phosphate isomerase/epimerase
MKQTIQRRQFISSTLGAVSLAAAASILPKRTFSQEKISRNTGTRIKLSLNAYSFNDPLRAGTMSLDDVVDYCAFLGFDGLDATGYYFPGYPDVPSDTFLYTLKRRAFLNGITINGTGIKNDFAIADTETRQKDVRMVKNWIEAVEKFGATVIRIFSGYKVPDGYTFDQALEWMIPDIRACVEHGKKHGILIGLQNHNDFAKTADETIKIIKAVYSEWIGVILDTGRLRQNDPYEEIEKLLPYAVSWQLKEKVWYGEKEVEVDLKKINSIIEKGGYRGFLPIETLGPGDPKQKIENLLKKVQKQFG